MEQIYGWRELELGYWNFHNLDFHGMNKWNKPIAVVTVTKNHGEPPIKFYAPPLLFSELMNKPNTMFFKYEGMVQLRSGHFYPKFECIE